MKLFYCITTTNNVISAKHDVSKHVHSNNRTVTGFSPLYVLRKVQMPDAKWPRKILTAQSCHHYNTTVTLLQFISQKKHSRTYATIRKQKSNVATYSQRIYTLPA